MLFEFLISFVATLLIGTLFLLFIYEIISYGVLVIGGLFVLFLAILVYRIGKMYIGANKQASVWETIDAHLQSQGFNTSNKIEVLGTKETVNRVLPALVISIDMEGKRFAFTDYVFSSNSLRSKFLSFDKIKSGEILIGGKSTSTISTGVGGMRYGVAAGLGTSNSSTIVHSMEYRFTTNDVLNPFYTITIFEREVYESAPIYRHYFECASKLDMLVKSIIEKADV